MDGPDLRWRRFAVSGALFSALEVIFYNEMRYISTFYLLTYLLTILLFFCAGEYEINVLWNEMSVTGCPVIGHAVAVAPPPLIPRKPPPPVPLRDKIILTGHGLTTARVNRQAEFVIDATDAAPGKMSSVTVLVSLRILRICIISYYKKYK